jgi:signal recognition particle GTPase
MNKKFTGLFLIFSLICTVSLSAMESLGLHVWKIDPVDLTPAQVATMRSSLGTAKMVALCPSSYQYWGMVGVLRARGQDPRALIAAMPDAIKHDARKVSVQQIETSLKRLLGQKNMTVFDVMHAWACVALLQEKGSNPESFVASLKTKLATARIPQAYTQAVISKVSKGLAGIRIPQVRAHESRAGTAATSSTATESLRPTRSAARPSSIHEERRVVPAQRRSGFEHEGPSVTTSERSMSPVSSVMRTESALSSELEGSLSESSAALPSMRDVEEHEEQLRPEVQELQEEAARARDELADARRQIELLRAENDELRCHASPEQIAVAELRAENDQLRAHAKRLELNLACEEGKARAAMQAARQYAEQKAAVERQAYREKVAMRQEYNEEIRRLRAHSAQPGSMSGSTSHTPLVASEHASHPEIDSAYVADLERQLQEMQIKSELSMGIVQELLERGVITESDLQGIAQDIQGAFARELQGGDGAGTSAQEGPYEDPD